MKSSMLTLQMAALAAGAVHAAEPTARKPAVANGNPTPSRGSLRS
jgi:hypothetical protein